MITSIFFACMSHASDHKVTFASQNIAASNLSPFEYHTDENKVFVSQIFSHLQTEVIDIDHDGVMLQDLICSFDDTVMGVNQDDISVAVKKLPAQVLAGIEKKYEADLEKAVKKGNDPNSITRVTNTFENFLTFFKIEGDDVFTDRPAVPFNARDLVSGLEAQQSFGNIFVNYLKKMDLANQPIIEEIVRKSAELQDLKTVPANKVAIKEAEEDLNVLKGKKKNFRD